MKKLNVIIVAIALVLFSTPAFAADGATGDAAGWVGLAAGLAFGMAALGGTLGQGKAAAAAVEAAGRNPEAQSSLQTMMIIGMALIESLVIFGFIIAFLLMGKF